MQKNIELIKKFQKGDKKAFNKIVARYHGYVYGISLKYLKIREDAEDLTQDIFLKLYRNLKNFQFRSDIKTYLYRMVANASCNYFKKECRLRKDRHSLDHNLYRFVSPDLNLDEQLIKKEDFMELENAIRQLPDKYSQLIRMRDFEELTYKAISRRLKLTENTTKLRHYYALKKLKEIWKNMNG
ncbi:MAG: RNA polymerase sigma factor [bacterium]|nr:RNA polymerase sigma factor [bacterium]